MITTQTNLTDADKRLIEWMGRRSEYLKEPAKAVSRETYNEMLEVLPPYIYEISEDISYFVMSEFLTGDVSTCYATRIRDGVPEHICKHVTAESRRVTDGLPTHEDFDSVIDEIKQITSVEAQIYNDEDMLHACGYIKENYLSGTEATMLRAFEVIEETGCLYLGSAADIAYDYIHCIMDKNTLDWFYRYFDHNAYLRDIEFEEIAHEVWIHGAAI